MEKKKEVTKLLDGRSQYPQNINDPLIREYIDGVGWMNKECGEANECMETKIGFE